MEAAQIYVVKITGGEPRRLNASSGPAESFPSWSPDGGRIAFVRRGAGLVIAAARGGEERKLTTAYSSPLSWSPDGSRIAYADFSDNDHVALFVVDTLTGRRRQYTIPPARSHGDIDAAFSPDGRQIAFVRCAVGNCDVFVIPSEGGAIRQITNQHTTIAGLTWSPDGQRLVFSSRRRGPYEIWQTSARAASEPELIPVAGEEAMFPRFGRHAGGGLRLVYEQHISDSNIWSANLTPGRDGTPAVRGEPRRLIASTGLENQSSSLSRR